MEISDIVNLGTALSMRKEVVKLAIERELPEEIIWREVEIYRKNHPQHQSGRSVKSILEIVHAILPSKDKVRIGDSPIEDILKQELDSRKIDFDMGVEIGPYKADFLFPDSMLIVEADGQEYHSSPSQIERDNKRDKYLMKRGYTVLRFTGKEIYGSVQTCIVKILQMKGATKAHQRGEDEKN